MAEGKDKRGQEGGMREQSVTPVEDRGVGCNYLKKRNKESGGSGGRGSDAVGDADHCFTHSPFEKKGQLATAVKTNGKTIA